MSSVVSGETPLAELIGTPPIGGVTGVISGRLSKFDTLVGDDTSGYISKLQDYFQTIKDLADTSLPLPGFVSKLTLPPVDLTKIAQKANIPGVTALKDMPIFAGDTRPSTSITQHTEKISTTTVNFDPLFADNYNIAIPDFKDLLATIQYPDKPTEPDNIASYIPAPMDITDITDIVLPTMTDISLDDVFEGIRPVWVDFVPIPLFSFSEPLYESDLSDALCDWLLDKVANGGTGLSQEVEDSIFARGKARQQTENERAVTEANTYFASRGWNLPQGMLMAKLDMINREIERANSLLNNEIIIKQAELAQENTKFAIQMAAGFEGTLRQSFSQATQRLLDSAKAAVDAGVATANAHIMSYNAQVEAYKTDAVVFGEVIKGKLAKLDKFRIEMEGAKLSLEARQICSEIYKNAFTGANLLIELYRTRVQAANGLADIEKLKIEELQANIAKYNANVQGLIAQTGVNDMLLKRDTGKVGYIAEKIKYNGLEIERAKAESQLVLDDLNAQKDIALVKLEGWKQDLAKFEVDIKNVEAQNDAYVKQYGVSADVFKSEVAYDQMALDEVVKLSGLNVEIQKAQADIDVKVLDEQIRFYLADAERKITISTELAKIVAQVLHSMITAVSTGLSEGVSLGASQTTSNTTEIRDNTEHTG